MKIIYYTERSFCFGSIQCFKLIRLLCVDIAGRNITIMNPDTLMRKNFLCKNAAAVYSVGG